MISYASLSDDHFININLNTEMPLPNSRETVLDFFGRVQKQYPTMRNFYTRETGDFVLEEAKRASQRLAKAMAIDRGELDAGGDLG